MGLPTFHCASCREPIDDIGQDSDEVWVHKNRSLDKDHRATLVGVDYRSKDTCSTRTPSVKGRGNSSITGGVEGHRYGDLEIVLKYSGHRARGHCTAERNRGPCLHDGEPSDRSASHSQGVCLENIPPYQSTQ